MIKITYVQYLQESERFPTAFDVTHGHVFAANYSEQQFFLCLPHLSIPPEPYLSRLGRRFPTSPKPSQVFQEQPQSSLAFDHPESPLFWMQPHLNTLQSSLPFSFLSMMHAIKQIYSEFPILVSQCRV
ncbi:hypothetical protein QC760_000171 [Botrytis cinerea]